jgi:hypothetical protein
MKPVFTFFALLCAVHFACGQPVYCPVSFPGGVAPITYVQFGSLTHSSAATSTVDHEIFTSQVDTVYGNIIELIVRGNTAGNFTDTIVAYFDWNADGDFIDPGEEFAAGKITNSGGTSITESAITLIQSPIVTPATALVRMRIVKRRGSPGASCNSAGVGQAEDYSLYVVGGWPCSGTPNAGTASISSSYVCNNIPVLLSATAYTHDLGNSWQWEESPKGKGMWSPIPGATTPTWIEPGITAARDYRFMASCANASGFDLSNVVSAYNAYGTFTHNSPLCVGDTLQVGMSTCASCLVTIMGPNNFSASQAFTLPNVQLAADGWYKYTVTDNGCNLTTLPDSFFVDISNCQDSVWPGDVNRDNITNNIDALYLALHYGSSGIARPNASISYTAQPCPDWPVFVNNINQKHADCDGDGHVSFADTVAIVQNYSLVHPKGGPAKAKVSSGPDIYFDLAQTKFLGNNNVLHIPVSLGTSLVPMNNIYGIAAGIKIAGTMPSQSISIIETGSWLNETIKLKHNVGSTQVDFAYARTNGTNTSGYGQLFDLAIQLPPSAIGDSIHLYFDNVVAITANGDTLAVNPVTTSAIVEDPLSLTTVRKPTAGIFPNPSSGGARLVVISGSPSVFTLRVRNLVGQTVWERQVAAEAGTTATDLPEVLPSGVYLITVSNAAQNFETLRWVKQ